MVYLQNQMKDGDTEVRGDGDNLAELSKKNLKKETKKSTYLQVRGDGGNVATLSECESHPLCNLSGDCPTIICCI